MSQRKRDRTADTLSRRLDHAANIVPSVRDHLREQRVHISVLRAATGNTGASAGSHSDPTGRVATELGLLDYAEGLIDDALASIRVGVNLLDTVCRDALGHRTAHTDAGPEMPAEPLCDGGDESTLGDVTCGQLTETQQRTYGPWYHPSGLCDTHRKRKERWERRTNPDA